MSNIVLMDDDKPKVIGTGAIGTADPPSASNLGALWVDGALTYQSRWIGYLSGPDYIENPLLTSDMKNSDWEIEFIMRDGGSGQTSFSDVMRFHNESAQFPILLYISNTNKLSLELRNGSTYVNAVVIPTSPTFNVFFKVNLKKVGGTITLTALGNSVSITNLSGWNAQTIIYSRFLDTNADIRPLSIYNIKQYLNGSQIDCLKVDEPTGQTIVQNHCNPVRTGLLSDSTAHIQAWAPINL